MPCCFVHVHPEAVVHVSQVNADSDSTSHFKRIDSVRGFASAIKSSQRKPAGRGKIRAMLALALG